MVSRRLASWVCMRGALALVLVPYRAMAAQPPVEAPSAFNSAVESLIEFKAQASNALTTVESAAMPEALQGAIIDASFEEVAAEGVAIAAAGTPVGWVGLAAAAGLAGAAAGTKYCVDNGCDVSWLWNGSGVDSKGGAIVAGNINAGDTLYNFNNVYGNDPAAVVAEAISLNSASCGGCLAIFDGPNVGAQTGSSAVVVSYKAGNSAITDPSNVPTTNASVTIMANKSAISCDFAFSSSVTACKEITPYNPSIFKNQSKSTSLIPLANTIPTTAYNSSVSPDVLADAVNMVWQRAASQTGYKGIPFSQGQQVTSEDVSAWQKAGNTLPTVKDAVSTAVTIGGSSSSPTVINVTGFPSPDATTGKVTAGTATSSSSSSGQTSETCGLPGGQPCEVDWGKTGDLSLTDPVLESPDLSKFFSIFPQLQNYTVPIGAGSCSNPTIPMGQLGNFELSAWCSTMEIGRPYLATAATILWTITSLFILLSA